ncbi:MAG: pyridoxamine 5'-phosphate oxidase [Elusimicrobia bacterium RIFOXYA2_FULL_39_19]|nr:MAG: pyridoxamine 5'-phosphate oxidase [Elusimicrobia bacterium RIFOXYA2_FULL_39_19]
MRKIITEKSEIEKIIKQAKVCRLGLAHENKPYIVPMNFGYENGCLYFHSKNNGKKMEMIKNNSQVCFEIDIDTQIIQADKPCNWGMDYRSVIGFGKAVLLEDKQQKKNALDIIMKQYSNEKTFQYPDEMLDKVIAIKLIIDEMTGKIADSTS